MDAIVIQSLSKHFQKNTIRREYSTLKSELVRWIKREKRKESPKGLITALTDINITVKAGQTFGLVGRNGSGKSTLLKLVTGIYTPTAGSIQVNGRISALLELGAGFHPDFSGRENILINGIILGISRKEILAKTDEIIAFSELGDFIDEPVRTYSSGMYMRLAFSIATHVDPDILIIDEILAVGDEHFRNKSQAKMNEFRQRGKTIFLVTHDLDTLQEWCDGAAWLDGGQLKMQGPPNEVVRAYKEAISAEETKGQGEQSKRLVAPELKQPRSGPRAAPGVRWGSFAAEIESVSLQGANESSAYTPDSSLALTLGFRVFESLKAVLFRVELTRTDGLIVFSAQTWVERPPDAGALRLELPRLGLAPGDYAWEVSCHSEGACLDAQRGAARFSVVGQISNGVIEAVHHWTVEPSLARNPHTTAGAGG